MLIILIIPPLFSPVHAETLPTSIEVVYDQQQQLSNTQWVRDQGIPVNLYNLNAPDVLLEQLDQGLPNRLEPAKKMLLVKFQKMGHERLKHRFMTAYQAIIKATEYQLERYPAIVFDKGQSVIYGMNDLKAATLRYQQWKNNHAR